MLSRSRSRPAPAPATDEASKPVAPAVAEEKPDSTANVEETAAEALSRTRHPRVYIFLNSPAELEELWKKLKQPDFILMTGEELRSEPKAPERTAVPSATRDQSVVVRSVAIRGQVGWGDGQPLAGFSGRHAHTGTNLGCGSGSIIRR